MDRLYVIHFMGRIALHYCWILVLIEVEISRGAALCVPSTCIDIRTKDSTCREVKKAANCNTTSKSRSKQRSG